MRSMGSAMCLVAECDLVEEEQVASTADISISKRQRPNCQEYDTSAFSYLLIYGSIMRLFGLILRNRHR